MRVRLDDDPSWAAIWALTTMELAVRGPVSDAELSVPWPERVAHYFAMSVLHFHEVRRQLRDHPFTAGDVTVGVDDADEFYVEARSDFFT